MLAGRQSVLQPALDQIASLEATLAPYEQIKADLSAARARFRKLTDEFVSELKNRCGFMGEDKNRALILELVAQESRPGSMFREREAAVISDAVCRGLWAKYHVTLGQSYPDGAEFMQRLLLSQEVGVPDGAIEPTQVNFAIGWRSTLALIPTWMSR